MGHELYNTDNMFSVNERPWHGLGIILDDHPNIDDAKKHSGLTWAAEIMPMIVQRNGINIDVPNQHAVVRQDTMQVLGVVGNRYEIYQNDEMWEFIRAFQERSGIKLETAGSLKCGQTTWVLAKNETVEYVNNDPIENYFLFSNSFNGSSPIQCMFTNIRVVCNNTLTIAIKGATNLFKVSHTAQAADQLKVADRALSMQLKYQSKLDDAMKLLVSRPITARDTNTFLSEIVFPKPIRYVEGVKSNEMSKRMTTLRRNKITDVLNLVDAGAGADILGVKGTVYGVYQALTEWVDHSKTIKEPKGREVDELKFEHTFFGSGKRFKEDCFDYCLDLAA